MDRNIDGNPRQSTVYSWKSGTITAAGNTADTSLTSVTGFTNLFAPFTDTTSVPGVKRVRKPTKIKVKASAAAYIKINNGDVITLSATEGFEAEDLIINTIGISTGGSAVTITVYLQ